MPYEVVVTTPTSLTIEEHMIFYGQLKGMSRAEIKRQIPM